MSAHKLDQQHEIPPGYSFCSTNGQVRRITRWQKKENIKIIAGQHFQKKIGNPIREDSPHHMEQKDITTTIFTTENVSQLSKWQIHQMDYKEAEMLGKITDPHMLGQ